MPGTILSTLHTSMHFNPHNKPKGWVFPITPILQVKKQAQRGEVTCLESHSSFHGKMPWKLHTKYDSSDNTKC